MAGISADQEAKIKALLDKAAGGRLVQSMTELHEYLMGQKLAWKQRLQCSLVGVHTANRDGLGVSAAHVHELIGSIAAIGYSCEESRSICLEIPSGPSGDEVRQFNDKLVSDSKGKLAAVEPGALRYASIVGSHANQACRAFVAGIGHDSAAVTVDKKLSLSKLEMTDPAWFKAINEGVLWTIVSAEIQEKFPEYAGLAQAAGNTANQIASSEVDLQLCRKVSLAVEAHMKRKPGTAVQYGEIAPEILRSRPPSASSLPSIFSFVMKCSGGSGPDAYLNRTERYIRGHGASNRSLGADLWGALAAEIKGSSQLVVFRHMLLKVAFCCADRTLTVTDVKRTLTSSNSKVVQAEQLFLKTSRLLASQPNISEVQAALGKLEINLATFILGKKKLVVHETMEDACVQCLTAFGVSSPWTPSPSKPTTTPSSSKDKPVGPTPKQQMVMFILRLEVPYIKAL